MSLINIIKNYNQYKKSNRVRTKLINIFNKKYNNVKDTLLHAAIPVFSLLFSTISILIMLAIQSLVINFILFFAIITGLTFLLFKMDDKACNKKIKNINPYLSRLYSGKFMIFIKKRGVDRLNILFNKHVNEENIEKIDELNEIKTNIRCSLESKFINENKKKLKYGLLSFFYPSNIVLDASVAANEVTISLADIIEYTFNNIPIEELKDISKEEIDNILKDFTLDEKINISNIIKDRVLEKNDKEEQLQNNLEELKILKNERSNSNVNIINNKNNLIYKTEGK
jgi:hypothetical protein